MSKFMRISSVSRTNAIDMFTLGVSTSRGKENKIGQFGSGSLLGVLLWLRSFGESPIFCLNGKRVEFETRPILKCDGEPFHQVLQVEGETKTPLSVALEHGEMDWTEPRMALREWISNAVDNGADIRTCVELVDNIDCPEDEVVVFVPLNGECKKYWQNIDKHFLHFTKKQDCPVIEKNSISPCRVYRKGVFMKELSEKSLFDYNLDFSIDESRNGSSDSIIEKIMDTVFQGYNCAKCPEWFFETVVQNVRLNSECLEVRQQSWRSEIGKTYVPVLKKLAENGIRFGNELIEEDKVERIANSWYNRFIRLVPELDGLKLKSKAELDGHIRVEVEPETRKRFDDFVDLINLMGVANGKERPELQVFKTRDGKNPAAMGYYSDGVVSIWRECETSKAVIMEELCHHYSGATDRTRSFEDYLFRLISEMSAYFKN